MTNTPKITKDEAGTLILLTAILFGAWFRVMPAWLAGFPVNDGGMFYTMMKDLQLNNYIPPLYTSYNAALQIPFAYPPLSFYIGAGLSDLFNVSLTAILQWLPALFHTMCIPALFFLTRELTGEKFVSAVTALVFALTPHLNTWLSVGGGLTRSLGTFFMILTILFSHKVIVDHDTKSTGWAAFFGSLTVLSHTESTIFAIGIPIFIWLAKSRSIKSAIQAGWVALYVLLFAGPWYGLIIIRHGVEPLLSALQTGGQTVWSLLRLVNIDLVTEEPYLDILGVFGILGMVTLLIRKQYLFPLMLVVIYLIQPRSAHTVANIPLSIATGLFTINDLLPAISRINEPNSNRNIKLFLFILTPYLLINSIYHSFLISQNHVSKGERTAMQWVKENTPVTSQFLVLTGEPEPMCESSAEWFPALTERTSLSTLQGREWVLGNNFGEFLTHKAELQSCLNKGIECLNLKSSIFNTDYIYISVTSPTKNCQPVDPSNGISKELVTALENSGEYSTVYQLEDAVILRKIDP